MNNTGHAVPAAIYPFPDTGTYEMKRGERHDLVLILQIMLECLRLYYDDFGDMCLSGTYDLATEKAVKEYQRINGLSPSGICGVETWNRMCEEYNAAVSESQ